MKLVYAITPSWLVKRKKDLSSGVKNLEKLGLKVLNPGLVTRLPSRRRKLQQIHTAFADPKVEVILAQRGGYSSMKLLAGLDFQLIRKNPKIFAGFSDLSPLLNVIYERAGLITLHSPMIVNFSAPSRLTVRSFRNALQGFPDRNLFAGAPVKIRRSGVARGILKGGNLITLTALMGTEWEIDPDGAILFLEDVDQKLYEIDRCLTQWILAGKLKKVRGLILGDFKGLRSREVSKIVSAQMKIDFPLVSCSGIGHGRNNITLPVGARVELNTFQRALTLR